MPIKYFLLGCFFFGIASTSALVAQDDVRMLEPFKELAVAGKLRVELVPGDTYKAEIYSEDFSPDNVNFDYRGSSLRIRLVDGLIKSHEPVYIRLTYQELRDIRVTAGAQLKSDFVVQADDLRIKAGSGAQVHLEIEARTLEATASEGGQLELFGRTERQDAAANTGGQYDADQLTSAHTYVRAGTGGRARVQAAELLDAAANTGGWIEYRGNPEKKYTKTVLAGHIERY